MHPRVDDRPPGEAFALCYLALVVREDVIDAAGVYVELIAEILDGHGGAFNVPAGEALSPGAGPLDRPARLGGLPEREVARVVLEWVGIDPHRFQQLGFVDVAGQLAVVREAGDLEVNVAIDFVGVTRLDQLLDYLEHLLNVIGGLGEFVGGLDAQLILISPEALSVELGDLCGRLSLLDRGGDDLVFTAFEHLLAHVADVCNVLDVNDVESLRGQDTPDPVGHEV